MHRLLVAIAVLLLVAPAALAQRRSAQRFTASIESAVIYNESGVSVEVGDLTSRALGRGSVTIKIRQSGPSTMTIFTDDGSINARVTLDIEQQPDGTLAGEGTGRITGGTLDYRGARGNFTIQQQAVVAEGTVKNTSTLRGTITRRRG